MLVAVEIEPRELAGADKQLAVGQRLLEPPGVEAERIGAYQAAGIRDATYICAHVPAALPQRGHVEREPRNQVGLTEIDIHRPADAASVGEVAARIHQRVVDGNQVESTASIRQRSSLTTPIAEHVWAVNPGRGVGAVRGLCMARNWRWN